MSWRHAIAGAVVLALGVLIGVLVAGGDDSEGSDAASTSTEAATTTSVVITTTVADTTTVTTGVPQTVPTSPPPTTPEPTTPEPTTPEPTYVYPDWEYLAQSYFVVSLSDHTAVIWTDPLVRFDLVYHEGVPALQVNRKWWFISTSDPGEPWRVCLDEPATGAASPIKLSLLGLVEHWYGCVAGEGSIVVPIYVGGVAEESVQIYYNVMDLDA